MKSKMLLAALAVSLGVSLAGCDQIKKLMPGSKPSGQVVATVNGDEITALELRTEMSGFGSPDPTVMKAAQQQALQQIIMRRLLVQKAKEAKLDKSANYNLQVRRGQENLLAQLYERKLAGGATAPTKEDAQNFVASQPDMFANRRILVVNQILVGPNKIPAERFQPLKTLEEVKALFDGENVPYQENVATIDTLSTDPRMVEQINKLPPGEVFIVPQRGAIIFNRIVESESAPFRGDLAVNYAMRALQTQRTRELVGKQLQTLRKDAEPKIVYAAGYAPPKPAAAKPAAASPAPATPAPAVPATTTPPPAAG